MYDAGSAGVCFSVVVRTGTSVLTQDVVPYFKGLIHMASWDWAF